MKVDHTFAMTDGFSSISEGFFMERIIWNIIFHMKSNYYFLNLERILNSLCEILGDDFANKSAQNMGFKNKESIHEMFSLFKNLKIITFYPDGSYIYK